MALIILHSILNEKHKLRDEILIILLSFFALAIITLSVCGTAVVIKKWFGKKRTEMCIATFKKEKDRSDEQPLQSEVDFYSTYWNRDSTFSEFSYFEPIKNTEVIEMSYMDGTRLYV